jgi:hypothetical protein
MLEKEITPVYIKNHTRRVNTKCRVTIVKAAGRYSYHTALKGEIYL